jgi:hypothetical protein
MTAGIPDVLADPVGVIVAMISGIEPALELAVIEEAVTGVAGGRAKRRKLAQALARRPAILADGRSPAPRAAGDLLVALRKAGAGAVSPRSAPGAESSCAASSAAARTGSALPAGPSASPARAAARSGSSTCMTGTAGRGARNARQPGTRWPS